MFFFHSRGSFRNAEKFLKKSMGRDWMRVLDSYGQKGVQALSSATPKKSGKTASSWNYKIEQKDGRVSVVWNNTNINDGVNIAIILQYGHGTGRGGYVAGRDYINPALQPIFDDMADKAWKEVTSSL